MRTPAADGIFRITSHHEILPGVFKTIFQLPVGWAEPLPGQFVQIEPSSGLFPLTRRPFTVNAAYRGKIEVIFDVVGRGTSILAGMEVGSTARILGPLGEGWDTGLSGKWLLIGGGLGAAGFQFLIDSVECCGILLGASSANRLIPLDCSCEVSVATEDGSAGIEGLVTDLISKKALSESDHIALCGPVAMMEAVWNRIPEDFRDRVQVSTESRMGCGWGVCAGCSIPVTGGKYLNCCTDGPVFPGRLIDWKRWKEAGL